MHAKSLTVVPALDIGSMIRKATIVTLEESRAKALEKTSTVAESVTAMIHHLGLFPDDALMLEKLGSAVKTVGQFNLALAAFTRSLDINPTCRASLLGAADALFELGRLGDAIPLVERAVAANPKEWRARHKLGVYFAKAGRHREAVIQMSQLLDDTVDLARRDELQFFRGLTKFAAGDFSGGGVDYEHRELLTTPPKAEISQCARWAGEPLSGKKVLIVPEQGHGDLICFSRLIPRLLEKYPDAVFDLYEKPGMEEVLSLLPVKQVNFKGGEDGAAYDYFVPLMSLILFLGINDFNIPQPTPVGISDASRKNMRWMGAHATGKFKIGIVWSGNASFAHNRFRSTQMLNFLRLAAIPGVQLYSLQKGPARGELIVAGANAVVKDLDPCLNNFSDTAAAIEHLDLIVMTDTSVFHLASSMNKKVLLLLHTDPSWVYTTDDRLAAWYPSATAIRQNMLRRWDDVFDRAVSEVERLIKEKAQQLPL